MDGLNIKWYPRQFGDNPQSRPSAREGHGMPHLSLLGTCIFFLSHPICIIPAIARKKRGGGRQHVPCVSVKVAHYIFLSERCHCSEGSLPGRQGIVVSG